MHVVGLISFAVAGIQQNNTRTLARSPWFPVPTALGLTCSPHSSLLAISDPPSTSLHNTGFLTGEALWQPSARNNGHPCPPPQWVTGSRPFAFQNILSPRRTNKRIQMSRAPLRLPLLLPPPAVHVQSAFPRPLHKDSRPIGGPASVFTWKPGPLPAR